MYTNNIPSSAPSVDTNTRMTKMVMMIERMIKMVMMMMWGTEAISEEETMGAVTTHCRVAACDANGREERRRRRRG